MLLSPGIPWARIGLIAGFAFVVGMAGFKTGQRWVLSDWTAEKAAQAQAERDAAQEAQRLAARLATKSQGIQDEYAAQARKERAAADRSRDAAGRLYDDLAAAQREADDADASCGTDAPAAALRDVLRSCVSEYRDMAQDAGELAGTLDALQRWTGSICTPSVTPEGSRGDK